MNNLTEFRQWANVDWYIMQLQVCIYCVSFNVHPSDALQHKQCTCKLLGGGGVSEKEHLHVCILLMKHETCHLWK